MSDSNRATVEVIKARKLEKQAGVLLPGSGDSVVYSNARRKLSVVETCNGEPGTTTSLRIEVLTDEQVTTANRPNYRIAVDIPLNEALVHILATALDRAEENAHAQRPSLDDLIEEDSEGVPGLGFRPEYDEDEIQDPTVRAVLEHADREAEKAQVDGLEEAAFGVSEEELIEAEERRREAGAEIRPTNDHEDVTN